MVTGAVALLGCVASPAKAAPENPMAVKAAGRSVRTLREWCLLHDIGRRIGGQWAVSKVALAMWLDGNKQALVTYLAGDRRSPAVTEYFERCDIPLPTNRAPKPFYAGELPRKAVIGTKTAEEWWR